MCLLRMGRRKKTKSSTRPHPEATSISKIGPRVLSLAAALPEVLDMSRALSEEMGEYVEKGDMGEQVPREGDPVKGRTTACP